MLYLYEYYVTRSRVDLAVTVTAPVHYVRTSVELSRHKLVMVPSKQPQLGSLAIQAPEHPQIVHVSPSTCHDLSLFKGNTIRAFGFSSYMSQFLLLEILREYRRLDDTITMRLNRANATMRDQERMRDSTGRGNVQEQACLSMWRELVGEFLQV